MHQFFLPSRRALVVAASLLSLALMKAEPILDETMVELTVLTGQVVRSFRDPEESENLFEEYSWFLDGPDQAVVVKQDGYCIAAFRGTDFSDIADILQNVKLRKRLFCTNDRGGSFLGCCRSRLGYWEAYYKTNYIQDFEDKVRSCVQRTCPDAGTSDTPSCLVLTGHSAGGSAAAVAMAYWSAYLPLLITTGMAPTLDWPCSLVNASHAYRWVNTMVFEEDDSDTTNLYYDIVPFLPQQPRTNHFGHYLLVSDDTSGVAYLGLNANDVFFPRQFAVHAMRTVNQTGYHDRFDALLQHVQDTASPLRWTGFVDGSYCSKDEECQSRYCERSFMDRTGLCQPSL